MTYVNDPHRLPAGPEPMSHRTQRHFTDKSWTEAQRLLRRAAEIERNAEAALSSNARSAALSMAGDLRKMAKRLSHHRR